jgi:hypothetical protein
MTTFDTTSAKVALTEERERIVHQMIELGVTETGELTGDVDYGDGFADAAAATHERTEVLVVVESLKSQLSDIDAALAGSRRATTASAPSAARTSRRTVSSSVPRRSTASTASRAAEALPGSWGAPRPTLRLVASCCPAHRRERRSPSLRSTMADGGGVLRAIRRRSAPRFRRRPVRARPRRAAPKWCWRRSCTTSASATPAGSRGPGGWPRSWPASDCRPPVGWGLPRHAELGAEELRELGAPESSSTTRDTITGPVRESIDPADWDAVQRGRHGRRTARPTGSLRPTCRTTSGPRCSRVHSTFSCS